MGNPNYSEFEEKKAIAYKGSGYKVPTKTGSNDKVVFTGAKYAKLPGSPSPFARNNSAPKVKIYRTDQHIADTGAGMELGGGGRFKALEAKISHEPGIDNPAAVAAAIGRKKYGGAKMAAMAAAGRK